MCWWHWCLKLQSDIINFNISKCQYSVTKKWTSVCHITVVDYHFHNKSLQFGVARTRQTLEIFCLRNSHPSKLKNDINSHLTQFTYEQFGDCYILLKIPQKQFHTSKHPVSKPLKFLSACFSTSSQTIGTWNAVRSYRPTLSSLTCVGSFERM